MRAPLAALQFTDPDCGLLSQLSAEDWTRTLRFCDRTQLTLPLAIRGHAQASHEVRVRFDRNLCGNATRWRRVQAAYREIAEPLEQEGSEFVVLKGFFIARTLSPIRGFVRNMTLICCCRRRNCFTQRRWPGR